MEIQRIAVVRLDKIGDLILTTPAIASLRAYYPKAKITAIVSPYNKVVLEGSSLVDEIWEWKWSSGDVARLQKSNFDLLAVFSPTTASYSLAFLSGAKIRAGYVYANRILPRLLTMIFLNKRIVAHDIPHEVLQNLEVIKALGVPAIEALKIEIPLEAAAWVKERLPQGPKIGIQFSKSWETDLPKTFLSDLVFALNHFAKVIIIDKDHDSSRSFNAESYENLTFQQWAALVGHCNLFISPNTGSLHLAASQGVPVLAVFDAYSEDDDEKRWHPWKVPYRIFRKNDPKLSEKILSSAQEWLKKN